MKTDLTANTGAALFWFRRDLRLTDNPGLLAAIATGRPLICVYIDDISLSASDDGAGNVDRWRAASVDSLAEDIAARGGNLLRLQGDSPTIICDLVNRHNVAWVGWTRHYDAASVERDSALKSRLKTAAVEVQSINGNLLREPWEIRTNAGTLPRTFAAFWRRFQDTGPFAPPLAAPSKMPPSPDLSGEPTKIRKLPPPAPRWQVGEAAAGKQLAAFVADGVSAYGNSRELFENDSTSLLAPHLAQGEISPRQVWYAAYGQPNAEAFLRQVAWREFAHALMYQFPDMASAPIRPEFGHFPWRGSDADFAAWRDGQTGYPLIDAAMRQLAEEGFMNNRLRMVVASFLIKHLLVPWQRGEAYFRSKLVDADHANNAMGWQWTAGCGVDAAPYFRIFNPIAQGQKFDGQGNYVKRWVPELASLDAKFVHEPWAAPPLLMADRKLSLGKDYPKPMIEHSFARRRALDAMAETKAIAAAADPLV